MNKRKWIEFALTATAIGRVTSYPKTTTSYMYNICILYQPSTQIRNHSLATCLHHLLDAAAPKCQLKYYGLHIDSFWNVGKRNVMPTRTGALSWRRVFIEQYNCFPNDFHRN